MKQRSTNMVVFGFLGVVLGILLAAVAGYSAAGEIALAILVGGVLGGFIGSQWSQTPDHRRSRTTSK